MSRYTYGHIHGDGDAHWYIKDKGTKGYCNENDPVVFTMPFKD